MTFAYVLAWLTPVLLGSAVVALLCGLPRTPAQWAYVLGCGFVLGALLCALAVAPLGRVAVARIVPTLAPILLPLALGAWVWVWLRPRASVAAVPAEGGRLHPLLWALLALLAVRVWLMMDEILLRPMYPWDAWAAWLLKPKAWMLGGHIDRFVGFDAWLADASGALRTAQTWSYPETLGRLAIWFAAAWGEWNAAAVGAIWIALWLALLCGTYGQLRALGLARDRSLIAVYALGSLPLINVHVALAGYADLWIAAVLAFACLAWMRWLQTRQAGHLILAGLFAVMLPLIKLEGGIWLLILAATMLYERMTPRIRRIALALAPVIGCAVVVAYLLRWPLVAPALDRIGLSADTDVLVEHAPAVVAAAAEGLFAQYNWHLFWFAVALTLAMRWRQLLRAPALRVLGLFLLLGCAFLFALFVLTPAGKWAESYTAVNRLTLQIVPAMLVFAALLWREPAPAEAPAPAGARMAEAVPTAP
jgi:hypothetical protein